MAPLPSWLDAPSAAGCARSWRALWPLDWVRCRVNAGFVLSVAFVPGLLACGGSLSRPAQDPSAASQPSVPPQLLADRVEVVEVPERPVLQLVRRNGDPHGAVSMAAFPEGGSRAAVALGALVQARLRAAGMTGIQLQSHALGLVVGARAASPEAGSRLLRAFRAALAKPVDEEEPAVALAKEWVAQTQRRAGGGSAVGLCAGELGADAGLKPAEPFTAKVLEEWRRSAFAHSRVGLAALGSEPLLEAVRATHDEPWPEAPPPDHPWPETDEVHVVDDASGRVLRVGWHVPDTARALSVARAIAEPHHPLHHRLEAVGRWRITASNATVRPRGACLFLDLRTDGARPATEELAQAAAVTSLEMERALSGEPEEYEQQRALLAPSDPLAAAALAAWSAVRSAEPPGHLRRVVEYVAPSTEQRPKAPELAELIERTTDRWRNSKLPLRFEVEDGQAETWVLLASPCGTRGEPAQDAGMLALATQSLTRAFQGTWGVTLEPWSTPDGIGVLAHAPRRPGESPQAQAERIARALGRALAGDRLDGRAVADMRAKMLDRLGADTGWWLALETVSGDFPSALEPFGTWKAISTASTTGVERARAALAQGPLKLAVLADHDASQAHAAAAALSDWLAPFRDEEEVCPKPSFKAPTPGVWTLETIDEGVREGAYLSVWVPGARELGQATAYLLNRPGGWLHQALTQPGLVAHAEAHWFGGGASGALVIELGAEPAQLDAAVHQARALLDRLSQGAVDAKDVAAARAEQVRREAAQMLQPRGRIVRLWHERAPVPVTLEPLRELHKALAADQHLVVRVRRRE